MKKINKKFASLLILIQITVLLLFQNCSYYGGMVISSNGLEMAGGGGGNGQGYDGKLAVILYYKDQTIFNNAIALYSGETFKYEIIGGQAPYTVSLNGGGTLDTLAQTYTAPYLGGLSGTETIDIQDANSATAQISIKVLSFLTISKIFALGEVSAAPVVAAPLVANSANQFFSLLHYSDIEVKGHGVLRRSDDMGATWVEVFRWDNDSAEDASRTQLFVGPNDVLLYLKRNANPITGIAETQIWQGTKSGESWQKLSLLPPGFNQSKLLFVSDDQWIALGTTNSVWTVKESRDRGLTWQDIDSDSLYACASDGFIDKEGAIWISGNQRATSGLSTLIIKKSIDYGKTWQVSLTRANLYGLNARSAFVQDSLDSLYFTSGFYEGTRSHWYLFRLVKGDSDNWQLIRNYAYLEQASDPNLYIDAKDNLFIIGSGLTGANTAGIKLSYLFSKSSDLGLNWNLIMERPYADFSLLRPDSILAKNDILYGTMRVGAVNPQTQVSGYIKYIKSIDGGLSWTEMSNFQPTIETGGTFFVKDLIQIADNDYIAVGKGSSAEDPFSQSWQVKKSTDGGLNFRNVDPLSTNRKTGVNSVFKSSLENIFTIGVMFDYKPNYIWMVRKSIDGGTSWTTSDQMSLDPQDLSALRIEAQSMAEDEDTNLYVSGFETYSGETINNVWSGPLSNLILRKSVDQGTTWNTIFKAPMKASGYISKLIACGNKTIFSLVQSGAVRVTRDSGKNWNELNLNEMALGQVPSLGAEIHYAQEMVCDLHGQVYLFTRSVSGSYGAADYQVRFGVFRSQDHGFTWTAPQPILKNIMVNSAVIIGSSIWLGGAKISNNQGVWTVVKANSDFSEMYEVDRNSSDTSYSSVEKLEKCGLGLCVIGNEQLNKFSSYHSILKVIQIK